MEVSNKSSKIEYISFISVVSMFAVLVLHTNGVFWVFSATDDYWRSANVIECAFYFAVPLFYMISGITLMDLYDRGSLKVYFIKRFNKTVIPFIAWSFICLAFEVCRGRILVSDLSLKYIYQAITGTSIANLYWFFTSLFIIYLCMPLFAAVDKNKRKNVFLYLVVVGIILNNLIPFCVSIFKMDLNTPYNVPVVSGALIWPILGWLLHNCEMKKSYKLLIYAIAFLGFQLHVIGTYRLSMEAGEIVRSFKGYQNVPSIMYAVGIFVLLKDLGTFVMSKDNWLSRLIIRISKYTFPIYLMQYPFLVIAPKLPFVDDKSLIYRLGAPFVLIPIMIGITWVMRKIPIIKRIVP